MDRCIATVWWTGLDILQGAGAFFHNVCVILYGEVLLQGTYIQKEISQNCTSVYYIIYIVHVYTSAYRIIYTGK